MSGWVPTIEPVPTLVYLAGKIQSSLGKIQRCCVRRNVMEKAVDLPGAAHLVLADGVVHLDPAPAVFDAMLEAWSTQQRARFLRPDTVKPRLDLILRFARFSNQYPWQWEPAEAHDQPCRRVRGRSRSAAVDLRRGAGAV